MRPHKDEARQRGGANRASGSFRLLTNADENNRSPLPLQLYYLSRRLGMIDPATLAALAILAFGERPA